MSKFNLRGKLTLTLHSARNLATRVLVGQQDPFAEVYMSGQRDTKFKTKVAKDAHKDPVWEQSYLFNLEGREELMHCNVYHEGSLSNDHIGRLDLSLDALDMSGTKRWYQLKDKENFSKQTGEVCMSVIFEGSGLPEGSTAFTTHQARLAKAAGGASPAASAPPAATIAPPVIASQQFQSSPQPQQSVYHQPPPQQNQYQSQAPPPQQQQQVYGGYPGNAPQPQYQSQAPPQQPAYQSQAPVYQPPAQPMYQQPPAPVYQAPPMQPVYASQPPTYQPPAQPVYGGQPVYQQPGPVYGAPQPVYQQPAPQPVMYSAAQPQMVYQQQPAPGQQSVVYTQHSGQIIGYWPNGQPRYAGQ